MESKSISKISFIVQVVSCLAGFSFFMLSLISRSFCRRMVQNTSSDGCDCFTSNGHYCSGSSSYVSERYFFFLDNFYTCFLLVWKTTKLLSMKTKDYSLLNSIHSGL